MAILKSLLKSRGAKASPPPQQKIVESPQITLSQVATGALGFSPGARVKVVFPGASRFLCRVGDMGEVIKVCRWPLSPNPETDLYFVRLDSPRRAGNEVVYCSFAQLEGVPSG